MIGPEKAGFLIELLDTVGRKDLSTIVREFIDRADSKCFGGVSINVHVHECVKIQGMIGGHGVGGACSHDKAFGLSPFPISKRILY